MSSRRRHEQCRICGGALQGNQRRWLFSGTKRNQNQTPSGSGKNHNQSQSQSNGSSPWGSMASLGSSISLTKSHLSSNSSKSFDLLSVLTHILGCSVSRSQSQSEFICGKCVSVLERVFKYDTVIARVRVLSSERLQRLTLERDKIRQWVRSSYSEKNPQDAPSRGSTSEDEEKDGYRQMLRDNMALSEYECWSERWDTCPYFIRTGKRCRKGKGCEGCDALRVSDSDYESVCGVPRHLPFVSSSPLAFSRDKSRSMPLDWQRVRSESCSSPASLAGSTLSLPSRTESTHSLDSLDRHDPLATPQSVPVDLLWKELCQLGVRVLHSPAGSRIPVLDRDRSGDRNRDRDRSYSGHSRNVIQALDFENGDEDQNGLTELRDEFLPLHQQSAWRLLQVMELLRAQSQSLEKLQHEHGPEADVVGTFSVYGAPLEALGLSLRSKERLLQECMLLIHRLCEEEGKGAELSDKLTEKLSESLKEAESQTRAALDEMQCEAFDQKHRLEEELQTLRKTYADREGDLDTLQTVLQANQDLIQELRLCLGQREQQLEALSSEREVWAQTQMALNAALSDKHTLLLSLRHELDSCHRDLQALSDSVLVDASLGGESAALVHRLKEREKEVSAVMKEREENSTTMCQEVTKLTSALQHFQTLVQSVQDSHSQTLASLQSQLSETRAQLRERERQTKRAAKVRQQQQDDFDRQKRNLQDRVVKRDRLIEQILEDAEQQEHVFRELQQNLQNKLRPPPSLKHTL